VLQHNLEVFKLNMKKLLLVLFVILMAVGLSMAQDVLGAHLVYGRGCVACHAPHSGAAGNGINSTGASTGNSALWGEDMSPLYGKTLSFGDAGKYAITLPADAATVQSLGAHDGNFAVIACLSCHDGNLAKPAMMTGTTVEPLPATAAGSTHPPTFLGNDGTGGGNYLNDHPVGPLATVGCGGQYNWDCTYDATTGKITFASPAGTAFLSNYFDVTAAGPIASLVKVPGTNSSWVTCTTCHDQHSMTDFKDAAGVRHPTMFFVKGWYNPASGNSAAQFCRSCHGGESNEMHGVLNVPTT